MNIIFDAHGGDNSPNANIDGMLMFLKKMVKENVNITVTLVGNEEVITPLIDSKINNFEYKRYKEKILKSFKIVDAKQEVLMEDNPKFILKHKKDSSMVVAINLLKDNKGDILVSCGNTGALVVASSIILGRIKGIKRPVMLAPIKILNKNFVLLDTGANTEVTKELMMQFALIGKIYMNKVEKVLNPKVGLLNIGVEEEKGNELYKTTNKYLKKESVKYNINYIGNVEARDPFNVETNIDVLVADGFTGNIFLKTLEGFGKNLKSNLKTILKKLGILNIVFLPLILIYPVFKKFLNQLDYKKQGGGLFLGINKPILKSHGSSTKESIYYTLIQAHNIIKEDITKEIETEIIKLNEENIKEEK